MMKLLEDLRFVIGLLFAILGLLVLGAGLLHPATAPGTLNANIVGGVTMTAFAALMLALALFGQAKGGK
jgi:hypothetical protein